MLIIKEADQQAAKEAAQRRMAEQRVCRLERDLEIVDGLLSHARTRQDWAAAQRRDAEQLAAAAEARAVAAEACAATADARADAAEARAAAAEARAATPTEEAVAEGKGGRGGRGGRSWRGARPNPSQYRYAHILDNGDWCDCTLCLNTQL